MGMTHKVANKNRMVEYPQTSHVYTMCVLNCSSLQTRVYLCASSGPSKWDYLYLNQDAEGDDDGSSNPKGHAKSARCARVRRGSTSRCPTASCSRATRDGRRRNTRLGHGERLGLADDAPVGANIADEVDLVVIADRGDEVGEAVLVLRGVDGVCDDGLSDGGVVGRHEDDFERDRIGVHRSPRDGVATAEVELSALLGLCDCDGWNELYVSRAVSSSSMPHGKTVLLA